MNGLIRVTLSPSRGDQFGFINNAFFIKVIDKHDGHYEVCSLSLGYE